MLIIDDNQDAVESLQLLLGLQGCQARTAGDGPAGLELARTWMPDAVLCDIGLPGMDGFAVAAALRADPRTRAARLAALTGYGEPGTRERALAAGFEVHLVKPVEVRAVLAWLGSAPAETFTAR